MAAGVVLCANFAQSYRGLTCWPERKTVEALAAKAEEAPLNANGGDRRSAEPVLHDNTEMQGTSATKLEPPWEVTDLWANPDRNPAV